MALVVLGFADETQKGLVIGLLITAVGFNAAIFCGFNVNHIDLSPNHSGFLMGITNGISNIGGILAPLAVEFIVTDNVSFASRIKNGAGLFTEKISGGCNSVAYSIPDRGRSLRSI